ncbi:MAG TPA: alpha-L-fucosidase [Phycisphaerales bacterium]|nr:alpha-L-fucosidase [Phycisphaerales bacterium]
MRTVIALVSLVVSASVASATVSPPPGFRSLFSGRDLSGWQGLAGDPPAVAAMSDDKRAEAQAAANEAARTHWTVRDGVLHFDKGWTSLQTVEHFGDFELRLEWRIEPGGDSGIYIRACPQVQIWDNPVGSGGLYNNQVGPSRPTTVADRPPGEWNDFRIIVLGDRVTVFLNGVLVVNDTALENYWDRTRPIPTRGPIELQAHDTPLQFRNIWVRELDTIPEVPGRMDWWREARFGMFIHWGLYAIPAGEWNGREVPGVGEWIMHFAQVSPKDYEPLASQFNPVSFDAREWARLAREAGMRYLVITSKHHDGFCLFESGYTEYDVIDATPFKRDIMRELADACRAEGIRIGWYHSIMDWHHPDASGERFPAYADVLRKQVVELLANYGPVDVMWFDGEWIPEWTVEHGVELERLCRAVNPAVIVNNRVGKRGGGMGDMSRAVGDFATPEQTVPATGLPGLDWESCITMNDTWGFKANDHNWKSADELLRMVVDIASKGGNLLLNVGPTAEGLIPQPSVDRLRAVGEWLDRNGEAIYGTTASPFRRLPWGRCTRRGETLYLHVFDWPTDGRLVIDGLQNRTGDAWFHADPRRRPLPVERDGERVVIHLPAGQSSQPVTVVALRIEGEPDVVIAPLRPGPDGVLELHARDATIEGVHAQYEVGHGKDNIGFWTDPSESVSWEVLAPPGRYAVEVEFACDAGSGGAFLVKVGDRRADGRIAPTGSWTSFVTLDLGPIALEAEGVQVFRVRPVSIDGLALMNLKAVRLRPAD